MIPKKIHYVWVGGNPFPNAFQKYVETWQKFCPDYEIIRWDESNFDINQNRFCKEAYDSKKWAFVADYMRIKILYDHGGIYLDSDAEVVQNLDRFLDEKTITGFEGLFVGACLIGAENGSIWLEKCLEVYENKKFILENGELDLESNVKLFTEVTKKMYPDLKLDGSFQKFSAFTLYPNEYFSPIEYDRKKPNPNTYTIHHFAGTWLPRKKFSTKIKFFIKKVIGAERASKIVMKNRKKELEKEEDNE